MASGAVVDGRGAVDGVEVHENAHIAEGAVVGDRSIVGRNAVVANNVKIYPLQEHRAGLDRPLVDRLGDAGPSTLFGRNGVRGLANVDVTPEMAMRLAMSYGTLISKGSYVTTSRDTHQACRVFKRAIISGLNSTGVNVRDLTTAPLAVNRFDIKSGNAVGGIHVQMSLENPEHIEILFSEAPGVPLDGKRERAIENHYFREDFRRAAFEEMGQVVYPPRVIETYTNSLLENWNTVAIRGGSPGWCSTTRSRRRPSSSRPRWTSLGWRRSPSTPSPGAARASRSARACRPRPRGWGRWSGPWRPTWGPSSIRERNTSTWSTRRAG